MFARYIDTAPKSICYKPLESRALVRAGVGGSHFLAGLVESKPVYVAAAKMAHGSLFH
jgi:hypothetical protein